LIQSAITHFEGQDTSRAHAQYARALHRQALAFGAEGKERLRKIKSAAAKEALLDSREQQGTAEADSTLTSKEPQSDDFEKILEFGFR
jgi:hypothetical protein